MICKNNSTYRDMVKKVISHPCYYCYVIQKSKTLTSDASELGKTYQNLIRKG